MCVHLRPDAGTYLCEFAVPEGYVRAPALQGCYDIPQRAEALVDGLSLLHLLPSHLRLVDALRTWHTVQHTQGATMAQPTIACVWIQGAAAIPSK